MPMVKAINRTHFARILTLAQVNECVRLLSEVSPRSLPSVSKGESTFEYFAPDGDNVFAGLLMNGEYICRLHVEVFSEDRQEGAVP